MKLINEFIIKEILLLLVALIIIEGFIIYIQLNHLNNIFAPKKSYH